MQTEDVSCARMFIFIGAAPRTDWLKDVLARDDHGFILTGPDLRNVCGWTLDRPPHHLETSVPGVFVAGDVRSESAKRVAAAVGEGSMAVMLVHRYLAEAYVMTVEKICDADELRTLFLFEHLNEAQLANCAPTGRSRITSPGRSASRANPRRASTCSSKASWRCPSSPAARTSRPTEHRIAACIAVRGKHLPARSSSSTRRR